MYREIESHATAVCTRDYERIAVGAHQIVAPEFADAELVARVRQGDLGSFGELFSRHHDGALILAQSISRKKVVAEDIVSEVFESTLRAIRGGAGPRESFRAYLHMSIRNVASRRAEQSRRVVLLADYANIHLEEVGIFEADGSDEALLRQAFTSLPERWQNVLRYRYVLELSGLASGDELGLNTASIDALVYRARAGLREAYLQAHILPLRDGSNCAQARANYGALVTKRLTRPRTVAVLNHISWCAKCSEILAGLVALFPDTIPSVAALKGEG